MITAEIKWILILLTISSIAYVIPDLWIHMRNPVGASILLVTNAICMSIYAYYYYHHEYTNPTFDKMSKMIISGLLYFFAWVLYLETLKSEKFSMISASQTIIMFVLGGAFAMAFLENKYNCTKIVALALGLAAVILFSYGESLPSYQIFNT